MMPKQGDIIKISLNPTKGHEQSGYRPVLVINNINHSRASNLTIVCPITSTNRQNPMHVKLIGKSTTKGFVMCDQVRSVDLSSRDYKIIETINQDIVWEVCDIVKGAVDVIENTHI